MRGNIVLIFTLFLGVVTCNAFMDEENEVEARGKKKKLALFVYFADLVIKKIFILKLIYAFVLWVVLHKAGYFLGWFVSYLKEKKHKFYHDSPPHHHYEYGPQYGYGSQYNPGPYKRQS